MKTLQNKQEEFLRDTINHFNSMNRGIDVATASCSYKDGCAIGRHLSIEMRNSLPNCCIIDLEDSHYGLPKWLLDLDIWFLSDVQCLHDEDSFWSSSGLSDEGVNAVTKICLERDLNVNNVLFGASV